MITEYQLRLSPRTASSESLISEYLSDEKGIDARSIRAIRVLKRSVDARQRNIMVNLSIRVYVNELPQDDLFRHIEYQDVSLRPSVIVIGAGPGGLFASLRLIELGLRPVILERGKNVHDRKKDIAQISRAHKVDSESNYSFGEGGAGAYSDGKLYTRSKKRGNSERILNIFCQHGASEAILTDAHPHIGTDRLPRVIENIRNRIIGCGGEVHFQTRMSELIIEEGRVIGARSDDGREFMGPVILATGHSARDVYRYLYSSGIDIEAKALAMGVRLEHPSFIIDCLQYHNREGRGKYLPAAEYNYVHQAQGRGVYSFCMCPGGFVVPAASGPEQIVVNGMSPSGRNSRWSNSGMVVEMHPYDLGQKSLRTLVEDYASLRQTRETDEVRNSLSSLPHDLAPREDACKGAHPLSMMCLQEALERQCWIAGTMRQTAPSQRMTDFVNRRLSADLPESSYLPGTIASPLHFWMPEFITSRLKEGFLQFGRMSHGFLTSEALMLGVETRTSSPVRIIRDNDTLQHIRIKGLFPCGEGAGYAGGIVSAAVDGERCAECALAYLSSI